jgi:hypothetical protein
MTPAPDQRQAGSNFRASIWQLRRNNPYIHYNC